MVYIYSVKKSVALTTYPIQYSICKLIIAKFSLNDSICFMLFVVLLAVKQLSNTRLTSQFLGFSKLAKV